MPWSNNSGGPWGGGSSGGNGSGGGRNPWGNPPPGGGNNGGGRGPGGGGGGGGGPQPPNLDELFRQSQERLRRTFGGGGGGGLGGGISKAGLLLAGLIAVAVYAYLCFYRVDANEQAVVLRFGEYSSTQGNGAHFKIWPIDTVEKVPVTNINQTNVGFIGSGRGVPSESLMLAGDENIIDIHFSVFWQIADPKAFLFNVSEPVETVKAVAESAMREVVGRPLSTEAAIAAARAAEEEIAQAAEDAAEATGTDADSQVAEEIAAALPVAVRATRSEEIRGSGRQQVMDDVQELIQETLDSYKSGIIVTDVQLDKADPPPDVIDDFRDVQAAQQDQDRLRNEADKYFNQKVAAARGEAAEMLEQAEAYRARVVAEAIGQAARFESIYEQYDASDEAREVIRKRLYLETMERVFGGMNKIILDETGSGGGGSGVVPYLPLDQLQQGGRSGIQSQSSRGISQ